MRQCTNGYGVDSTVACQAYLTGTDDPIIRHLFIIGTPGDPASYYLTDHEAPVVYAPWGTFQPAVITRGDLTTKIGTEIQKTTVNWTPGVLQTLGVNAFTQSLATANPVQLATNHIFDNWPVRIWKIFMPSSGDAMTLGGYPWFGGRVASCKASRSGVIFTVSSFLDVVTQKLPPNVIESTSTLAGYTGASLVAGETGQPTFTAFAGSTTVSVIADCTSPSPGKIYPGNIFVGGYMVFLSGPGATLAGYWSAIGNNGAFTDGNGNHHSAFAIYSPLPWAPTPGVDTFYVSPAAPINLSDGDFYGFPYVPAPVTAV
jgi:hypothetical protein